MTPAPPTTPRATTPRAATPTPRATTPRAPAPEPVRRGRWATRAYAAYLLLRGGALLVAVAAAFIVLTSLAGAWAGSTWSRAAAGVAGALLAPLLLRARLRRSVARRTGRRPALGGPWFLVGWNLVLLSLLCLGFADPVGRAVRRRGDWFLGELDGPLPRRYRRLLAATGSWMERFDLPPEARPLLAEAIVPQQPAPRPVPGGTPPQPGTVDPTPVPAPAAALWYHPLVGPRTAPPNAACRFGAPRPGPRPAECELGHCGIDLVQAEGSPVHAVHDGVVYKVVRDEAAGGIAGRFMMLTHKDGALLTSYIHLQELRSDLRVGQTVRGGEVIGTLGRTGCRHAGPHLHFALALRRGGGLHYIDPEAMVRNWELPSEPRSLVAEDRSGAAQVRPGVRPSGAAAATNNHSRAPHLL